MAELDNEYTTSLSSTLEFEALRRLLVVQLSTDLISGR